MPIPTALYYRASSTKQIRRGSSIPDQRARLLAEAAQHGETIVSEYVDQARSGTSAARRADYQRMLTDARAGLFVRLRIESVDRGHRNDLERRQFEAELQRLGVEIVYNGEPEQQAPDQRKLQRGVRGVIAEWESDITSQRTYKRHVYRAQKGLWRGGPWPYGLKPDGHGWFERDPESYPALIWLLEQRAAGHGHHMIAKQLNRGISLDGGAPQVPPTPGLLAYQRRPYLERQDPETGEVIRLPRRKPSAVWVKQTVLRLCAETVDGIYAGVLSWGRTANRFTADGDGKPKRPLRIETGNVLIPPDLLRRVQAVELAAEHDAPQLMSPKRTFLLELRCRACGQAMHGYTSTKYKNGRAYKYRKYRCAGRANTAGSCRMPMLSADVVEQRVLEAVFSDVAAYASESFRAALNQEIERQRQTLLNALELLADELMLLTDRRESALDTLTDRHLSPLLRAALSERVESTIRAIADVEVQQRTLRAGLQALEQQARNVVVALTHPLVVPERWREQEVYLALKRALQLLVHHAELTKIAPAQYVVELWLYDLSGLIRANGSGESAWESNPPAKLVTPPNRFEDGDQHRPTPALTSNATRRRQPRQGARLSCLCNSLSRSFLNNQLCMSLK